MRNTSQVIALQHCRYPKKIISQFYVLLFSSFHINKCSKCSDMAKYGSHNMHHNPTPQKIISRYKFDCLSFSILFIRPCEYLGNIKLRLCDDKFLFFFFFSSFMNFHFFLVTLKTNQTMFHCCLKSNKTRNKTISTTQKSLLHWKDRNALKREK